MKAEESKLVPIKVKNDAQLEQKKHKKVNKDFFEPKHPKK